MENKCSKENKANDTWSMSMDTDVDHTECKRKINELIKSLFTVDEINEQLYKMNQQFLDYAFNTTVLLSLVLLSVCFIGVYR